MIWDTMILYQAEVSNPAESSVIYRRMLWLAVAGGGGLAAPRATPALLVCRRACAPLCAEPLPATERPAVSPPSCQPVAAPHPATIAPEELQKECDVRHTRGSGPGGQHRNKVSTAVVLTHRPTQVSASASEERSQARNVAIPRCGLVTTRRGVLHRPRPS